MLVGTEKKEVLVSIRDLEIKFDEYVAVSNVNFDIYKGETFSLVGESGSGKTTIGRALMRIHETSKGDIFFKGKRLIKRWGRVFIKNSSKKCK